MNINPIKLTKELTNAGIQVSGCNSNGVVWDIDGTTEIQKRADVKAIVLAHDPTPDPEPPSLVDRIDALSEIMQALVEVANV